MLRAGTLRTVPRRVPGGLSWFGDRAHALLSTLTSIQNDFASETIGDGRKNASSLLVTCEHAGNSLPSEVKWGENDLKRELNVQHWAFDPGAREFAIELAEELDCAAVMSRFSRLYLDVNRPVASPTMFRRECDGYDVELNKDLDAETIKNRIASVFIPYHFAVQHAALKSSSRTAVSVHTFNKSYEGSHREFEIGVLHSVGNEGLAKDLVNKLNKSGFSARVNEPWSGKQGFMYSADSFAYSGEVPGQRDAIMFEFRNDVCVQPSWRKEVISVVGPALLLRNTSSK